MTALKANWASYAPGYELVKSTVLKPMTGVVLAAPDFLVCIKDYGADGIALLLGSKKPVHLHEDTDTPSPSLEDAISSVTSTLAELTTKRGQTG